MLTMQAQETNMQPYIRDPRAVFLNFPTADKARECHSGSLVQSRGYES